MRLLSMVYGRLAKMLSTIAETSSPPIVSSTCCHALYKCFEAKKHVLFCITCAAPTPHSCTHCLVVIGKCPVLLAAVRHVKAVTESPFRAVILAFDPRAVVLALISRLNYQACSSSTSTLCPAAFACACNVHISCVAGMNLCPYLKTLCASDEHLCVDLLLSASFGFSFVHIMCNRNAISYPK